ncbi:MAG: tetratricopeptide repeat protein [Planctomycetota bacterium]
MTAEREFTPEEADRHNALTSEGWALIEGAILQAGGGPEGAPGWLERRRLHKASRRFEQAIAIHPRGWSSLWALGKIHQRLGREREALAHFLRSHEIKPEQPDVAREAGLSALDCGDAELSLRLCRTAVANAPDDLGLVANLALAHMLGGDDAEAMACATRATEADPNDEVSATILALVREVADGTRPRPADLRGL